MALPMRLLFLFLTLDLVAQPKAPDLSVVFVRNKVGHPVVGSYAYPIAAQA